MNGATRKHPEKFPERFLRLVQYLRALSTVGAKTARTPEHCNKVLWLPLEAGLISREQDESGDVFRIEVKKERRPPLPPPPERCRRWIDKDALHNLDTVPELCLPAELRQNALTTIHAQGEEAFYPDTFARKEQQWREYIEQQWKPWRERCRRALAHKRIYTDLFRLYQERQKLGEQYELLLCFGLLIWETPNRELVRRHLITAEAAVSFEPALKKLTVYQTSQFPRVELDMLSPEEQPQNALPLLQDSSQARPRPR